MIRDEEELPGAEVGKVTCPECGFRDHEFAVRSHLLSAHDWTPSAVNAQFPSLDEARSLPGDAATGFGDVFSEFFGDANGTVTEPVDWPGAGESIAPPRKARESVAPPREDPVTSAPEHAPEPRPARPSETVSEVCACDPKYKETQVIQRNTGLNIGGLGGNRENGVTVLICKNCARQYTLQREDGRSRWVPFWNRD